jgi:hypothetical protein
MRLWLRTKHGLQARSKDPHAQRRWRETVYSYSYKDIPKHNIIIQEISNSYVPSARIGRPLASEALGEAYCWGVVDDLPSVLSGMTTCKRAKGKKEKGLNVAIHEG